MFLQLSILGFILLLIFVIIQVMLIDAQVGASLMEEQKAADHEQGNVVENLITSLSTFITISIRYNYDEWCCSKPKDGCYWTARR